MMMSSLSVLWRSEMMSDQRQKMQSKEVQDAGIQVVMITGRPFRNGCCYCERMQVLCKADTDSAH